MLHNNQELTKDGHDEKTTSPDGIVTTTTASATTAANKRHANRPSIPADGGPVTIPSPFLVHFSRLSSSVAGAGVESLLDDNGADAASSILDTSQHTAGVDYESSRTSFVDNISDVVDAGFASPKIDASTNSDGFVAAGFVAGASSGTLRLTSEGDGKAGRFLSKESEREMMEFFSDVFGPQDNVKSVKEKRESNEDSNSYTNACVNLASDRLGWPNANINCSDSASQYEDDLERTLESMDQEVLGLVSTRGLDFERSDSFNSDNGRDAKRHAGYATNPGAARLNDWNPGFTKMETSGQKDGVPRSVSITQRTPTDSSSFATSLHLDVSQRVSGTRSSLTLSSPTDTVVAMPATISEDKTSAVLSHMLSASEDILKTCLNDAPTTRANEFNDATITQAKQFNYRPSTRENEFHDTPTTRANEISCSSNEGAGAVSRLSTNRTIVTDMSSNAMATKSSVLQQNRDDFDKIPHHSVGDAGLQRKTINYSSVSSDELIVIPIERLTDSPDSVTLTNNRKNSDDRNVGRTIPSIRPTPVFRRADTVPTLTPIPVYHMRTVVPSPRIQLQYSEQHTKAVIARPPISVPISVGSANGPGVTTALPVADAGNSNGFGCNNEKHS